MKERQLVDALQQAGATSPQTARDAADLGFDTDGVGWRRLRDHAVVRESSPGSGRYYVDLEVWRAVRRTRHRLITVLLLLLVLAFVLALINPTNVLRS